MKIGFFIVSKVHRTFVGKLTLKMLVNIPKNEGNPILCFGNVSEKPKKII